MKRTMARLVACLVIVSVSARSQAALIDFTIPDGTSFAPIPPTYQPLSGVTIDYTNVGIYNGTPDHTSGTMGTDNYYSYPSSGNGGTELFSFSSPVNVSSFWYGVFDNTDSNVKVVASIYSNTTATGTPLDTLTLTPTFNNTAGPVWTFSGTALAAFTGVRSLTFATTDGTNDAVNIDDITVTPAPEPSTVVAFLGLGAVGLILAARRRMREVA